MYHLSFIILTGVSIGLVSAYIFMFIANSKNAIDRRRRSLQVEEILERIEKEIKKKVKKN